MNDRFERDAANASLFFSSPDLVAPELRAAITDDDIAQAVSAISIAPDPTACIGIFRHATAGFGADGHACGEVDLRAPERTVFYAVDWPERWRAFYLDSGLARHDPLIAALAERHAPFTWSELRRSRKWKSMGAEALQMLAQQGWSEGLVVPIRRGEQRYGFVSLYFRDCSLADREKALLAMLSYCFHDRLRNLAPKFGFAFPPAGLTRREIDTLRLIAVGATDRQVAGKLGISPATAHEYFEKAKAKLRGTNRAATVAVAVSLAIVSP